MAILFLWWTFFGFGGSLSTSALHGQPVSPHPPRSLEPRPIQAPHANGRRIQRHRLWISCDPSTMTILQCQCRKRSATSLSTTNLRHRSQSYHYSYANTDAVPPVLAGQPVARECLCANRRLYSGDFRRQVYSADASSHRQQRIAHSLHKSAAAFGHRAGGDDRQPGRRQVMLRSPMASSTQIRQTLNVAAPPTPNYSYIGIIGTPRYVDTAILQDKDKQGNAECSAWRSAGRKISRHQHF